MYRRIASWAETHLGFSIFICVNRIFEFLFGKWLLLRFFCFTKFKDGVCLSGSIRPKTASILKNSFFKAMPFLMGLAILALLPQFLPQSIADCVKYGGDTTVIAGFMTAILAIAGIFLTLFYSTSAGTLSNRYPSSTGIVSDLFTQSVANDADLAYCNSFVIVSIGVFLILGFGKLNLLVTIYAIILAIVLIIRLPKVLRLSTSKADINAITSSPANRFLALAKAASFNHPFHQSLGLMNSFRRLASREIDSVDKMMDYALSSGDYAEAYSRAVGELAIVLLANYSRVSALIPVNSSWHIETSKHNSWFLSSHFEIDLAIQTGTMPSPKTFPDQLGFHKRLYGITEKYRNALLGQTDSIGYLNWLICSSAMLDYCIEQADMEWIYEFSLSYLSQSANVAIGLAAEDKTQLQVKCQILEYCALAFVSVSLGITKLCHSTESKVFNFESFRSFSQEELQRKGFPLGRDEEMQQLCGKMEYEKRTYGFSVTPAWYFNETMKNIGLRSLKRLCAQVELVYVEYVKIIQDGIDVSPSSCYVFALKETELFHKSLACIECIASTFAVWFDSDNALADRIEEIEKWHIVAIELYPRLVASFSRENDKFEGYFPDLYGFACFNYCEYLFGEISRFNISAFMESIPSLYYLVSAASSDLTKGLEGQKEYDWFRVQALAEPTLLFFELCGVAYCIAELENKEDEKKAIEDKILAILVRVPSERERWAACLKISKGVHFGPKPFMDMFRWRHIIVEKVSQSGLLPERPIYPFGRVAEPQSERERRLFDMFPVGFNEYVDFSGCSIFEKYLFPIEDDESGI